MSSLWNSWLHIFGPCFGNSDVVVQVVCVLCMDMRVHLCTCVHVCGKFHSYSKADPRIKGYYNMLNFLFIEIHHLRNTLCRWFACQAVARLQIIRLQGQALIGLFVLCMNMSFLVSKDTLQSINNTVTYVFIN